MNAVRSRIPQTLSLIPTVRSRIPQTLSLIPAVRSRIPQTLSLIPTVRSLHTTPACMKIKAGRVKQSRLHNKPITYEQAFKPEYIQHKKGWLSYNTSNLHGEEDAHQMAYEDLLIRQFFSGTFYRLLAAEIIIKRRLNILEIIALVEQRATNTQIQYLATYSEGFLANLLGYNVRVHLFVASKDDMIFKYV